MKVFHTHYNDKRFWLHIGEQASIVLEWGRVRGSRWADIRIGGHEGTAVGISGGLGWGCWLTFEMPYKWARWIRLPYSTREIGLNYYGGYGRLMFWHDPMGTHWFSGGKPNAIKRTLANGDLKVWDNAWILGREKYAQVSASEPRRILVPINEWPGDEWPYDVHIETVSWTNRFRTKRRTYWEFKAVDGVSYNQRAGKGENSWDLDDDGIYGCSFEYTGQELPQLVEEVKQRIFKDRRRYGQPSAARATNA